jgi:repressor LexA
MMSNAPEEPPDQPNPNHALTPRQQKIRRVYRESVRRRGRPPAYREIGKAVGLASPSSVAYQLSILRSNGYLPDLRSLRAAFVPVIGSIPAGSLSRLAEEDQDIEGYFPLPRQVVGDGELFLLKVVGDSMINAAIMDGDWIVVRQQHHAETSDIVAAMIEGPAGWEATVKTFEQKDEGGRVWLMPQNPAYKAIPGDHAVILGRVVAVLRSV